MRIAIIGDIVGRPGRRALKELVPGLVKDHRLDMVIANGENAAGGFGITADIAEELLQSGVDVITSGNHIWDRKEIEQYFDTQPRLLRPANFPIQDYGHGHVVVSCRTAPAVQVGVINISGRVFMGSLDCPFQTVVPLIDQIHEQTNIVIVDFHAEATSEKMAMGWYLDGRISCLVGTHTHVQTADEQILPGGTAYISDLGMTGAMDSVIGMKPDRVIAKFLTSMPQRYEVATNNVQLHGVLLEVEKKTGTARRIERLKIKL
ncbi:MAG: TIGR00282 family metallophosphoesterase [Deltaproteobacteria bacterium]|nr:TIGR00282 family metallophosphoesterase [Candidatus Anaeroferrophillus wilburensis]MBN2889959.1 TIGR00282 family metallophosphoesterase [Deltaproteobacteria bacterium]